MAPGTGERSGRGTGSRKALRVGESIFMVSPFLLHKETPAEAQQKGFQMKSSGLEGKFKSMVGQGAWVLTATPLREYNALPVHQVLCVGGGGVFPVRSAR